MYDGEVSVGGCRSSGVLGLPSSWCRRSPFYLRDCPTLELPLSSYVLTKRKPNSPESSVMKDPRGCDPSIPVVCPAGTEAERRGSTFVTVWTL